MSLLIVSNRLPVNIHRKKGTYEYSSSPGGLASGMRSYVEKIKNQNDSEMEISWVGWPGASVKQADQERVKKEMAKNFGTQCIFLSEELIEKFYHGFCNKTLWPLFHYFPLYAEYENEFWQGYQIVNEQFCNKVLEIYKPGDTIWVHDYHLMLLPGMIRCKIPDAIIGFFLHIPFPSYEMFKLLPRSWSEALLSGIYGSNLIAFQTHNYRTSFLLCTFRILGLKNIMGSVIYNNRVVKVEQFPMGIDYKKFEGAAKSKGVKREQRKLKLSLSSQKLILSIDRQDYTKGILQRLLGFEMFLNSYPEWRGKVVMMMVVIPSRTGVKHYQITKTHTEKLVVFINHKYRNTTWSPVIYQYRSLSYEELIALYSISDVALITPLRDSMNLIAKEFLATKWEKEGALILSEMAGAADELSEAIIIDPNNLEEISHSLNYCLQMSKEEQSLRISAMQARLIFYDIFKWSDDFLTCLRKTQKKPVSIGYQQSYLQAKSYLQ